MPKVKNWGEKELNFIQISSKQAAVWDEVRAIFPELLREEQVYMRPWRVSKILINRNSFHVNRFRYALKF